MAWSISNAMMKARNTSMDRSGLARYAMGYSRRETKTRRNGSVHILVAGPCKHNKPKGFAQHAVKSFCQPDRNTKPAAENAEQSFDSRVRRPTQWYAFAKSWPCSAAQLLHDVFAARRTRQRKCSGTQSGSFMLTLKCISNQGCHGVTMGKGLVNGA